MKGLLAALVLALMPATCAHASKNALAGPVPVEVLRVIDGDTFVAKAHIWPGHSVVTSIRVRGVDAPELRGRCAAERGAARKAKAAFAGLLSAGSVFIRNIDGDKYFGRVVADVYAGQGKSASDALLAAGHARPYGGKTREAFCKKR